MRIAFTPEALDDIGAQRNWLLARSPSAAARATDALAAKFALLLEHPQAAPAHPDGFRDARVDFGRDGFVVRYCIDGEALIVLRVFHGRQAR